MVRHNYTQSIIFLFLILTDSLNSTIQLANSCQYLANELGYSLAKESVCICDDDNDIEMALACSHSYIPSLTSKTMVGTLRRNQSNFTQTFGPDISSTAATEAALELIHDMA